MTGFTMTMQIPDGLMDLAQEFEAPLDQFMDAAAEYTRDLYKYYIDSTGGVRSGALHEGPQVMEGPRSDGGEHQKYVVNLIPYAAVYEYGWTERGQGQDSYYGRYPAQLAVEFLLASLESGLAHDALKARLTGRRPRS